MKVITLTLNPAYDLYCYTEKFEPYRENLAKIISRDAGGKGVNIGRALLAYGINAKNLVVLGEESAEDFARLLSAEKLDVIPIILPGRIRENITLATEGTPETRISFPGFNAEDSIFSRVLCELLPYIEDGCIITFSGRLPTGVSKEGAMGFLRELKSRGARLVIDTHALGAQDVIALSPWLIKPNAEEMERYLGKCESIEDIKAAAIKLCALGVENVMVSLGGDGALLATGGEAVYMNAPKVDVASTVGAGDSSIAGFISATIAGAEPRELLRTAIAFGSAACMTKGTGTPDKTRIDEILAKI